MVSAQIPSAIVGALTVPTVTAEQAKDIRDALHVFPGVYIVAAPGTPLANAPSVQVPVGAGGHLVVPLEPEIKPEAAAEIDRLIQVRLDACAATGSLIPSLSEELLACPFRATLATTTRNIRWEILEKPKIRLWPVERPLDGERIYWVETVVEGRAQVAFQGTAPGAPHRGGLVAVRTDRHLQGQGRRRPERGGRHRVVQRLRVLVQRSQTLSRGRAFARTSANEPDAPCPANRRVADSFGRHVGNVGRDTRWLGYRPDRSRPCRDRREAGRPDLGRHGRDQLDSAWLHRHPPPGWRGGAQRRGRTVLANHNATGVAVAVKYVADELRDDDEYLARFRADARRLTELESPNVAELYEYVESGEGVATVREYVDGASVRDLLAAGPLRPEAALSVLKGGLLGLAAIHANGAAHGGYKPENLLLDRDGNTKLADPAVTPTTGDAAGDVVAAVATLRECLAGSASSANCRGWCTR